MDINQLTNGWAETKSTLLEGLTASQIEIVDPILENQRAQLLNETAAAGSTQAADISGFRKIVIPMIRRIIPGTIATELVGVQAMSGPVGQVYTMRYKYAEALNANTNSNNNPFGDGTEADFAAGTEAFGNAKPIRQFYSGATAAGAQVAGASTPGAGTAYPGMTDIAGNAIGSPDALTGLPIGSAWGASSAASDFDRYLRGVGGAGSDIEGSGGRRMTLEVVTQVIEARSRKLQASWTIEAMQDMKNGHNMSIETEITRGLSAEIVQEIDAEIIADLLGLAGTVASYDASTAGTGTYTPTFMGDRFANLQGVLNYIGNEIARKTRRGAANFIVVSPMIVSVLQSAAKSVFAPAVKGDFKGPNNTQLAGVLNGRVKVYSYLWNQANQWSGAGPIVSDPILLGYKGGNGETDTGYFYCPYVPIMSSGVVMNPNTMQPVVSLMTRYGKTSFVNTATSLGNSADYYGKCIVTNTQFA